MTTTSPNLNPGDIIYLDLNQVELFGWERRKSDLAIDSIIRGIKAGDNFPAVPVMMINSQTFQLDSSILRSSSRLIGWIDKEYFPDGGHRRALGHYLANQPLKSRVTRLNARQTEFVRLQDIVLVDDAKSGEGMDYQQLKRVDGRYR